MSELLFGSQVVAESPAAEIAVGGLVDGDIPDNKRLADLPGEVRIDGDSDGDSIDTQTLEFDSFTDARAAFGLWQSCGPFDEWGQTDSVPLPVATAGQAEIGTYLYLGADGSTRGREEVADLMGVSKATVSNYLSRVRWDY